METCKNVCWKLHSKAHCTVTVIPTHTGKGKLSHPSTFHAPLVQFTSTDLVFSLHNVHFDDKSSVENSKL